MPCTCGWHSGLFQDRVFTQTDWKHQRSAWRLLPDVSNCTCVRVASLGPISLAVAYVTAISVVVSSVARDYGYLLDGLAGFSLAPTYLYITSALSLRLVFKTNSSYARWWEARKIWGRVFDLNRHLCRLAYTWFPDKPGLKDEITRWLIASPYVLRCHIIGKDLDPAELLRGKLTDDEIRRLMRCEHRPLALARQLSRLIRAANLSHHHEVECESHVQAYINCCGGCERIFKTPIPLPYTRHTARYLMIWISFLPVVLWPYQHWLIVFTAPIVAFLLLGLENIGIQIEEPFRILAIQAFCTAIEGNIVDMGKFDAIFSSCDLEPPTQLEHLEVKVGMHSVDADKTPARDAPEISPT